MWPGYLYVSKQGACSMAGLLVHKQAGCQLWPGYCRLPAVWPGYLYKSKRGAGSVARLFVYNQAGCQLCGQVICI